MADNPQHLFVYGTLRPDDLSGAYWTANFHRNTTYIRGHVWGAQLFYDLYPVVILDAGSSQGENREHKVHGFFVTSEYFEELLQKADHIVNYPEFFSRSIVEGLTEEGTTLKAWMYHR